MATWTPDPTFYPSPRLAMKAPQETLAYVASFDPTRQVPDALAVVDVDDPLAGAADIEQVLGGQAGGLRRLAGSRLERLEELARVR